MGLGFQVKNSGSKVNVEISADISCKIEIELNFSKNLTVTVTPKKAAKLSFTSILKIAVQRRTRLFCCYLNENSRERIGLR